MLTSIKQNDNLVRKPDNEYSRYHANQLCQRSKDE
jgi:hypothetical protein